MYKLLDLFCGAGGISKGYVDAGFEVVGVDNVPQPHYPYTFIQADALEYLDSADLSQFSAIHASPPCQSYSSTRHFPNVNKDLAPKLILPVRERLEKIGLPWVIENVAGSKMPDALILCGSMFGLQVRRHRWFSCSHLLFAPGACQHTKCFYNVVGEKTRGYGAYASTTIYLDKDGRPHKREGYYKLAVGQEAMGIPWMNFKELSQAIPPKYSEWIGKQLMNIIEVERTSWYADNKLALGRKISD